MNCSWCGDEITQFKDHFAEKWFKETGLCQECQDIIWKVKQNKPLRREIMEIAGIGFLKYTKGYKRGQVGIYKTQVPNMRGTLALELLQRYALITTKPDGEDTAGRQKWLLQSPDELVERVCTIADTMITELEKRDWLVAVPPPDDVE